MTFKIGDRVEALEKTGSGEGYLQKGKVYTVTSINEDEDIVGLEGGYPSWFTCRFRLAKEPANKVYLVCDSLGSVVRVYKQEAEAKASLQELEYYRSSKLL